MENLEQFAKEKWNKEADQFNQWNNLGQEEKDELIKSAQETYIRLKSKDNLIY
jgi:hypothetical protein